MMWLCFFLVLHFGVLYINLVYLWSILCKFGLCNYLFLAVYFSVRFMPKVFPLSIFLSIAIDYI